MRAMPQKPSLLWALCGEPPAAALLLGNSQPPSGQGHTGGAALRLSRSTSGRCPGTHRQEQARVTHCPLSSLHPPSPGGRHGPTPNLVSREAGLGRGH